MKNITGLRVRLGLLFWVLAGVGLQRSPGYAAGTAEAPAPVIRALPTVIVVGDSTARNYADGALGWGDPFVTYFDPAEVTVLNRAMAGRSSRTFMTEGRWDNVVKELKAGDTILIQLGHNDAGPLNTGRGRGSLPGTGEETEEITKADGTHEVVHTYGWYLRKFIADTRAKGATPILLSLTVRNNWKDGQVERGSGHFNQWISEVAKAQGVTLLDVTNIIADQYQQLGQKNVGAMFGPDFIHTSPAGAELNAASVIAGLKALNSPLVNMLSDKGKAVTAFTTNATTVSTPHVNVVSTANTITDRPAWRSRQVPANPALPSIFLIGDSTVRNGSGDGSNGQWGWGEPIATYFDQAKVNVVNRAMGGLSSRTYLTKGNWEQTLALVKPGDFVLMQFGHNDVSPLNDDSRARGTVRGNGEETEEIDNLLTKQHEVVHTYGWYLRKYISDAKTRGAVPVVLSMIPRNDWKDGKVLRVSDSYGQWAREAAEAGGAFFIDLNEISADRFEELGPGTVQGYFPADRAHTNAEGAELNARSVIAGIKALNELALNRFLAPKAVDIKPANRK